MTSRPASASFCHSRPSPRPKYIHIFSISSPAKRTCSSYRPADKRNQGNHYCARDYGSGASNSNSYHYSNTDGSYYYSNPNGSTYHNNGQGGSTYTAPSGNSYSYGSSSSSGKK
ncbi:hypothetical protein F4808DRAFT_413406 [Astrocystis sublimbata]|nr:hypothetical protein F4808DRAFT_413406 [Astrocystis sublimbata]